MQVQDVYDIIDAFAPFATQSEYDHSGLQVGSMQAEVKRVLVAVDLSFAVIDEATAKGCDLIVVHHPPVWHAMPALTEDDYTQRLMRKMVQKDLHCIAAHTNLDKCTGGNSERLIRSLGGKITGRLDSDEYAVTFDFSPMTLRSLEEAVRKVLPDPYAYSVGNNDVVGKGALCTGAGFGEEAWRECRQKSLVLLTGEVKHNYLRQVQDEGGHLIVFGHFASEKIFVSIIKELLESKRIDCLASEQCDPKNNWGKE